MEVKEVEMPPSVIRTYVVEGCTLGDGGGPYITLEAVPKHDMVLRDLDLHMLAVQNISEGG